VDKLGHQSKIAQRVVRGNPQALSCQEDFCRDDRTPSKHMKGTKLSRDHHVPGMKMGIVEPSGDILK